jgi:hypothetical protein
VDVRVNELPRTGPSASARRCSSKPVANPTRSPCRRDFFNGANGKPGVFVAQHGKAVWREVTLGLRGREAVEVDARNGRRARKSLLADPKQAWPLKKAAGQFFRRGKPWNAVA